MEPQEYVKKRPPNIFLALGLAQGSCPSCLFLPPISPPKMFPISSPYSFFFLRVPCLPHRARCSQSAVHACSPNSVAPVASCPVPTQSLRLIWAFHITGPKQFFPLYPPSIYFRKLSPLALGEGSPLLLPPPHPPPSL